MEYLIKQKISQDIEFEVEMNIDSSEEIRFRNGMNMTHSLPEVDFQDYETQEYWDMLVIDVKQLISDNEFVEPLVMLAKGDSYTFRPDEYNIKNPITVYCDG